MNRRELLAAMSVGSVAALTAGAEEPPKKKEPVDPWVGTYLKFAEYDVLRSGQFLKAHEIRITKVEGGYRLSKPYEHWLFREVKLGVLGDRPGGIGQIFHGTAEFSDGKKYRILRAEFCYEQFVLYDEQVKAE